MTTLIHKIPILRTFARQWELRQFQHKWQCANKHNRTIPMNIFPMELVNIGEGTYGELNVLSYYPPNESLRIGNYVSLAPRVQFILSGNHQTATLFTYPLRSYLEGKHCAADSQSKGSIVIEDEAWIGFGATILSGVTIGKGSIIAACSTVTHDIPPYAIAAGNPAKVIRYRIDPEIIPLIKDVYLKDIPRNVLAQNIDTLYTPLLDKEKAREIIRIIEKETHGQE